MTNQQLAFWFKLIIISGPFILIGIHVIHTLHIRHHLPTMLKALENSPYIVGYHRMIGSSGFISKALLITQIAGMVLSPKYGIKSGAISSEDIKNFPPKLLKPLRTNITLLMISVIWLIGVNIHIELK